MAFLREFEERDRAKVLEVAQAMLDGRLGIIEGLAVPE